MFYVTHIEEIREEDFNLEKNTKSEVAELLEKDGFILINQRYIFLKDYMPLSVFFTIAKHLPGVRYSVLKKIFLKLKIPIEKTTWSNIKKKKKDAFLTVLLALQTEYRADFIETILVWEQQLQTYRASRHFKGYPSNGQRTITNGCTAMKMRKVIAQLQKLA